jgi:monofunctional biosynthetic peptidoglycan transglycosylase
MGPGSAPGEREGPGSAPEEYVRPTRVTRSQIKIVAKYLVLAFVSFSIAFVICFALIPPPTTAFMVQRFIGRALDSNKEASIRYQWTALESISPNLALAVIASEDQKFPYHFGFDLESISDALEARKKGKRLRGASTITQQTAKNLFLTADRSFLRKGLEAYFTVLLELFWSKQRILEVYLNIAEFGDGVFGAHAAAKELLGKKPSQLTRKDAALMAAVLPNPERFKVTRPSGYVHRRCSQILKQMRLLGGTAYLDDL